MMKYISLVPKDELRLVWKLPSKPLESIGAIHPLCPLPGSQQQVADKSGDTADSRPSFPAGTELPGARRSPSLFGQDKE